MKSKAVDVQITECYTVAYAFLMGGSWGQERGIEDRQRHPAPCYLPLRCETHHIYMKTRMHQDAVTPRGCVE